MKQSQKTREKKSIGMKNKWGDPAYRKMMIEKQKAAGLRAYGTRLTYRTSSSSSLSSSLSR